MFRLLISSLLSTVYLAVLRLGGTRQLSELDESSQTTTTVIITSANGFRMTVLVSKVIYKEHYSRILFFRRKLPVYSVRSELSSDAPEALKLAVSQVVTFPQMLPFFVGDEAQVRRVVASYMDIIRNRVSESDTA